MRSSQSSPWLMCNPRPTGTLSRSPLPVLLLLGGSLLTASPGCMVGPDYKPPQEPVPGSFQPQPSSQPAGTATQPFTESEAPLPRWWALLGDPRLDSLVERGIQANLDIALASARIQEVRAARSVIAAGPWPIISAFSGGPGRPPLYSRASSTVNRIHTEQRPRGSIYGRETVDPNGLSNPQLYLTTPGNHPGSFLVSPGPNGPSVNVRPPLLSPDPDKRTVYRDEFVYEFGFDAVWELDVFGGLRRAIEAADAEAQAAVETRNDLLVIVTADIARNYMELRGLQERLAIARRNVQLQQRTVNLVDTRFRDGLVSNLDVALSRRQLATTESNIPILQAAILEIEHRLSVLLGMLPDDLHAELTAPEGLPLTLPEVPLGLPSELLRARPDIRRSERRLAAATARIGVATADLYPRFMLTGSFGMQTSEIRKILNGDSLIWSAGPGFRWPIFDAGRIVGNIHVQEAVAQEALLDYRRTLLTALQEVEDAMVNYVGQRERYFKLQEAVRESEQALGIAQDRYEKGLTDFLNVLDAQRTLYELEDQLAASQELVVAQFIALNKALGRGWLATAGERCDPPATTSQPGKA